MHSIRDRTWKGIKVRRSSMPITRFQSPDRMQEAEKAKTEQKSHEAEQDAAIYRPTLEGRQRLAILCKRQFSNFRLTTEKLCRNITLIDMDHAHVRNLV